MMHSHIARSSNSPLSNMGSVASSTNVGLGLTLVG
jgi:hypothetical protein